MSVALSSDISVLDLVPGTKQVPSKHELNENVNKVAKKDLFLL